MKTFSKCYKEKELSLSDDNAPEVVLWSLNYGSDVDKL